MVERIIFPEFRDQQEPTKYPFGDEASLKTTDGLQMIEPDTLLDAILYPIGGTANLFVTRISVTARSVTIYVGNLRAPLLCSGSFDPIDPPDHVVMVDVYGRPAGMLISEAVRLARFSAWPLGDHSFSQFATEFAASCVIPTPELGVRGILTAKDELLTGDVWIVGDNGVVVRNDEGHIRVDIVGDPLFVRKLCVPVDLFTPPTFIKTINGCPPDQFGNWNLVLSDRENNKTVIRLYPTDDGLVIEAAGSPKRE